MNHPPTPPAAFPTDAESAALAARIAADCGVLVDRLTDPPNGHPTRARVRREARDLKRLIDDRTIPVRTN